MGLFTLSNVISMLTTNFTVLLIARALPAFLHPVYVSMALTVAASTGSKEQASRAVAKVFIGVSAGMVLGVPVTSYIASELFYEMGMLFFTVVNALVLVYGLANIVGNVIAGKQLACSPMRSMEAVPGWRRWLSFCWLWA